MATQAPQHLYRRVGGIHAPVAQRLHFGISPMEPVFVVERQVGQHIAVVEVAQDIVNRPRFEKGRALEIVIA